MMIIRETYLGDVVGDGRRQVRRLVEERRRRHGVGVAGGGGSGCRPQEYDKSVDVGGHCFSTHGFPKWANGGMRRSYSTVFEES